jgi:hypothetical protein
VQGSYVYIGVRRESCTSHLYRCDISTPWDNNNTHERFNDSPSATFEVLDPLPDGYTRHGIFGQILRPVGFTTLHATIPDTSAVPAIINILFHPDIFTAFRASDTLHLLLTGTVCNADAHEFSTHSGNYLLVYISSAEEDQSLQGKNPQLNLIHFVKGPPASIQVRRLPISIQSELESDDTHSIAVDDHLGVLYLADQDGFIHAVPFA